MKPKAVYLDYLKFGFVPTRCQQFHCPACEYTLNAGPNHQPKRCENCGVKLDFTGITFEPEVKLNLKEC